MDESKYMIQSTILNTCPVCKSGKVNKYKPKGVIGFLKTIIIACEHCNAKLSTGNDREGEITLKLDLSKSDRQHKYDGQLLKKSEWEKGISDLDEVIQNNELPDYNIRGLSIILNPNEKTHYYTYAKMFEERAVRNYGGASLRLMKGVYIRQGQAESHGELREIDNGGLLLTNQRVIFDGSSRKIEYHIPKIIAIQEYKDGVQLAVSNRKKSQIYIVEEPHKLATYLYMATQIYTKEKKPSTSPKRTTTSKPKAESEALKILNLRYAKGEISREEYEQMKRDIDGWY